MSLPSSDWTYQNEFDVEWHRLAWSYAQLPRDTFIDIVSGFSEADYQEAMRMRFRYDRGWFLKFFWPDIYGLPFNDFHLWALSRRKRHWKLRAYEDDAAELWVTAAPRGNGKSALITRGECCHDTVYGLEGYTVIVAAGLREGSIPLVETIKMMLTTNTRLAEFYGPVTWQRHGEQRGITVGDNPPVGFFARSFTTQVRGTAFGEQRPTKFIIDDGEHPKRVLNPDNRSADDRFLREDILKAGPPEGGLFVDWVGTILHRDAQLPNLLRNRAWKKPNIHLPNGQTSDVWKAIWQWPKRMDLWQQCQDIWADLTNPNSQADAKAFYLENREAMDEGAVVMDPRTWPLFKLFLQIWAEGLQSFLKERQNDTRIAEYTYFEPNKFRTFDVQKDNFKGRYVTVTSPRFGEVKSYVSDMTLVGYLDPVPGKDLANLGDGNSAGAGDFAAFAVLGKDRFGYVYVLDTWLGRARDSEQLAKVWEMCEEWGVTKVGIESNNFARLITRDFRRSKKERAEAGKYAKVTFLDDHVQDRKEDRIASLQPPMVENGWLRMNNTLMGTPANRPELILQFEDFPNGSHDDGPDAISSAYRLLGGSPESRRPTLVARPVR